ncbi:MAG: type IV pilus assembly protein PilM [Patescibacteria group bacterium]|nr:type IV pilus assembly protein PilM [Patescibacteria group bacterium]
MGIDIGSTSVKIVELKKDGGQMKLVNYGFTESLKAVQVDKQSDFSLVAEVINKTRREAGIETNNAIAALPTFSVFTSVMTLPGVSKKDLKSAVNWEAKKVIPLPLEEMILDFKEIKKQENEKENNAQILLTGAPRALVKKYIEIFKLAKINLLSLETETFSLIRSLLGNDESTVMIVELGANTTDVSIIDHNIPMLNRSIDIGGEKITKKISQKLNIDSQGAEQFKYDLGISLLDSQEETAPRIITEIISPIVNEIKYAINLYFSKNKKQTEKIILSGGSALLPNLANYLSKILDMKVIVGDPWARISYPVDLRPLLIEIGPRMSVALGLAMRDIE